MSYLDKILPFMIILPLRNIKSSPPGANTVLSIVNHRISKIVNDHNIPGNYAVDADIGGYGWRSVYLIGCAGGIPIGILLFFKKDPR